MKRVFGIIFLCVIVLSGCNENSNHYSGIETHDILDISNAKNIEFVHEYKGHTDNWAAVYIVYKMKDTDKYVTRKLLKYTGKMPNPTGEITYDYDAGEDFVGSGGMSYIDEPKSGIYDLGPSAGESAPR